MHPTAHELEKAAFDAAKDTLQGSPFLQVLLLVALSLAGSYLVANRELH